MARMLSRRSLITLAATGAAGVILGRKFFGGPDEHLLEKGATTVDMLAAGGGGGGAATPQIVNASTLSQSLRALGNYIYLTPEKLGGGTHAVDLSTGKTLA